MIKRAPNHEFHIKLEKILIFKPQFSNLVACWGYGSYENISKFQLNISKITPVRPKKGGVNITIRLKNYEALLLLLFLLTVSESW